MPSVHVPALGAFVLGLATVASAQGLGDVAAQERAMREAKLVEPAKTYTESDLASLAPRESPASEPTPGAPAAVDEGTPDEAEMAEAEVRAKGEAVWRRRLDRARQEAAVYEQVVDGLQLMLNDTTAGFYNYSRASKIAFLEENKELLAQTRDQIATLEEEGRRAGYR